MVALVETAAGFDRLRELTHAPGVQRLAFGSIDFQLDLGIDEGEQGTELLWFRSQLVLASRLARLPAPIDGVTTAIDDADRLLRDARAARRLGFGAKLCIHPKQIGAVHDAFTPSAAELDWAHRVLDAVRRRWCCGRGGRTDGGSAGGAACTRAAASGGSAFIPVIK